MAKKLLTLIQDTTRDEIYPNIKEDNLPSSVKEKINTIDTKQDKLSETQLYAVNSGITEYKVTTYDGYADQIKKKQDKITASTVNPFVKTEDGMGIDLYQITLDANGNLTRGSVVDQIPTDASIEQSLVDTSKMLSADIFLTAEQIQSLASLEITFTQEQATLLEKASSFKFYYAGNRIAHGQCGKIIFGNNVQYGLTMILGGYIYSGLDVEAPFSSGILDYKHRIQLSVAFPFGVICDISLGINSLIFQKYKSDNVFIDAVDEKAKVYFDTINNNSIIHKSSTDVKNYDLGKSINLFGNHSILVPNVSSDTNIDLYQHSINIYGIDQGSREIDVYITVISSKNLNVDSLTDLKTLLGNEFLYSATGFYDTYFVYAINQTGVLINMGSTTSVFNYADMIDIVYMDTVTTI